MWNRKVFDQHGLPRIPVWWTLDAFVKTAVIAQFLVGHRDDDHVLAFHVLNAEQHVAR